MTRANGGLFIVHFFSGFHSQVDQRLLLKSVSALVIRKGYWISRAGEKFTRQVYRYTYQFPTCSITRWYLFFIRVIWGYFKLNNQFSKCRKYSSVYNIVYSFRGGGWWKFVTILFFYYHHFFIFTYIRISLFMPAFNSPCSTLIMIIFFYVFFICIFLYHSCRHPYFFHRWY